jgi:hypothetical protein
VFGFSPIFLLGILIFKGLTARRLYKSFGVKGLSRALIDVQNQLLCQSVDTWFIEVFVTAIGHCYYS